VNLFGEFEIDVSVQEHVVLRVQVAGANVFVTYI
jgi:hypothetical protein